MTKKVYLDNAATSPVRDEVIAVMTQALQECFGNPSSTHSFGRSAKSAIEKARKSIAAHMGAQASEIIFTSGGTEADNMILRCAVRDLQVERILTTKVEHHAVLHTAEMLAEETAVELEFIDVDSEGQPSMSDLENKLSASPKKALVSLMHVNNEIGTICDIQKVAELCEQFGAYFHSDTVQSVGHYPWNVAELPIHFLTAAAHKFHGPKGVGFAYIRKNTGMKSFIVGGGQERGFRAGTEPYHNILGMEKALDMALENLDKEKAYVKDLKSYFINQLEERIPGIAFNGCSSNLEKSTYTLVNTRLPLNEQQALMLLFYLDLKGIACSKGSACQSGSEGGSHVLAQVLDEEQNRCPSLRFSFSIYNTKEELDYVVEVLEAFVKEGAVAKV